MRTLQQILEDRTGGKMNEKKRYLEVVEIETKAVVHKIDVTDKSDRAIEKIERGMLTNMDTDRFYLNDTGA